jgi:hypothetical protein
MLAHAGLAAMLEYILILLVAAAVVFGTVRFVLRLQP